MKLTNPDSIQESEKEFIDTINAELDWEAIEKMLLEKHQFTLQEEVDYKDGDLVVYNNQIAYRFDFEIKVPLSVIFNRQGECLDISTIRDDFEDDAHAAHAADAVDAVDAVDAAGDGMDADALKERQDEKVGQLASNIADMISEINQGDE